MNLYRIIDKISLQIKGRLQPFEYVLRDRPRVLIFCTLGMGEIVCMTKLIENIPNVTLCIDRKEYIEEFIKYQFELDYIFIDSIDEIPHKFDVCIMPSGCMRRPEIKAMVHFKIPIRIGQFKNNRFKFAFNYHVNISNLINEENSFNQLLDRYENINSTILSI